MIDATYLGGHTFAEIEGMVHGGIETYVIPLSKSSVSGYATIVNSTESTLTTTKTVLDSLIEGQAKGGYKLGDIILMEATSDDGTKVFDRWVSAGSGDNVTLSVLETKVAKHHHTVGVTAPTAKALTGANPTTTTNAIPTVGAAVTVLTGTSGEVITSVSHDDNGGHNLAIATATSTDGIGHSHTVNAHSHTVKFTPSTLVSQTASAYTTLTSANYTPHTHTNTTVAGTPANASNITYVTTNSLTKGDTKSCGCIKSFGEEKISQLLRENNIFFEREKQFNNCRFPDTNKMARFDFYVNNEYIIEFDGKQHFEINNFFEQNLENIQEHDNFKNN